MAAVAVVAAGMTADVAADGMMVAAAWVAGVFHPSWPLASVAPRVVTVSVYAAECGGFFFRRGFGCGCCGYGCGGCAEESTRNSGNSS